jgi:hypothetical protein
MTTITITMTYNESEFAGLKSCPLLPKELGVKQCIEIKL